MTFDEVAVAAEQLDVTHPAWAGIVGLDVCVLPEAFPHAPPPGEGMVGWRGEVTKKRGSASKGTQQIQVYGAWFSLNDSARIRPIQQEADDDAEGDDSDSDGSDSDSDGSDSDGDGSDGDDGSDGSDGDSSDGDGSDGDGSDGDGSDGSDDPPMAPTDSDGSDGGTGGGGSEATKKRPLDSSDEEGAHLPGAKQPRRHS